MSDGRPVLFDAPHLRELNFSTVRLVLPWNAARTDGTWHTWLQRASVQGWPVLIAPTESGTAPSATDYESALRQLLGRYPTIDAVEGWNEPNHAAQPTAGRPALAAAYFDAAARACAARCTAVAGNLLDAASMPSYLAAYQAALTTQPAIWGVHNYYDATYFQRSGLDTMLALTSGPIWLTETGGLVSFQPGGPGTGLLPDEHRAADGLRWLFSLAAATPRLERMYLYGMWQEPWNAFDSALLRVDNSEREGMQVVRQAIGQRSPAAVGPGPAPPNAADAGAGAGADAKPGAPASSPTTATPLLRLVGKSVTVDRRTRRATLTIRCALADCTGRLTVHAGTWRYARNMRLPAGTQRRLTIRLPTSALTRRTAPRRAATRIALATLCHATTCSQQPIVRR